MKILIQRGYSFAATAERDIACEVKDNFRYSGVDYDTEPKSTEEFDKEQTYLLPDGNITTVGAERFFLRRSVVPVKFHS